MESTSASDERTKKPDKVLYQVPRREENQLHSATSQTKSATRVMEDKPIVSMVMNNTELQKESPAKHPRTRNKKKRFAQSENGPPLLPKNTEPTVKSIENKILFQAEPSGAQLKKQKHGKPRHKPDLDKSNLTTIGYEESTYFQQDETYNFKGSREFRNRSYYKCDISVKESSSQENFSRPCDRNVDQGSDHRSYGRASSSRDQGNENYRDQMDSAIKNSSRNARGGGCNRNHVWEESNVGDMKKGESLGPATHKFGANARGYGKTKDEDAFLKEGKWENKDSKEMRQWSGGRGRGSDAVRNGRRHCDESGRERWSESSDNTFSDRRGRYGAQNTSKTNEPYEDRMRGQGQSGGRRREDSGRSEKPSVDMSEYRRDEPRRPDARLFDPSKDPITRPRTTSESTDPGGAILNNIVDVAGMSHVTSASASRPVVVVRPQASSSNSRSTGGGVLNLHGGFPSTTAAGAVLFQQRVSHGEHAVAERMFQDVLLLEGQLVSILLHPMHPDFSNWWRLVQDTRYKLFNTYSHLLLKDIEFCNFKSIEQVLWKTVFYQVVEVLRNILHQQSLPEVRDSALQLVDSGVTELQNLLTNITQHYRVPLEDILAAGYLPTEATVSRSAALCLLSAQKLMLFLGDLARYREHFTSSFNFGQARNWYLKARTLAPKNGRPYNQLAVLACHTKRNVDAVYYYMRSLAASNAFETATQSLCVLFEEVRRKAEERWRVRDKARSLRSGHKLLGHENKSSSTEMATYRLEVWVHPGDGSKSETSAADAEEDPSDELAQMGFLELTKHFTVSFLFAHGKLYTKIGMETFPEAASEALLEFRELLSRKPCPLNASRLLQLVIINMFAVYHCGLRMEQSGCRSQQQEHATRFGLDMAAIMCERATQLVRQEHAQRRLLKSAAAPLSDELLRSLLSSLKAWSDWLLSQPDVWQPAPTHRDPLLSPRVDDWLLVAELCSAINELIADGSFNVDVKTYASNDADSEEYISLVLVEDAELAGFLPMLNRPPQVVFYPKSVGRERVEDWIRLDTLNTMAEYLCGVEPALLYFDMSTAERPHYRPCQLRESSERREDQFVSLSSMKTAIDVAIDEERVDPVQEQEEAMDQDILALRKRKAHLEATLRERDLAQRMVSQALMNGCAVARPTELRVVPVYLLPDTNCYIDFLDGVERLARAGRYTIVVPIVVLNELDGLARAAPDEGEHASYVRQRASAAVRFLEDGFEEPRRRGARLRLRAITAQGTLLETIAFRTEEQSGGAGRALNNDDLILNCCLHFCQDKARDYMPANGETIRLYREVVLLTTDRNLRLKAISSNVPSRTLPSFIKWARLAPTNKNGDDGAAVC